MGRHWPRDVERTDRPGFALVRSGDGLLWGVCAQVSGLLVDPYRRPHQLLGCEPSGPLLDLLNGPGAGALGDLGDLWLAPRGCGRHAVPDPFDDPHAPWRLEDARVTGHRRRPGEPGTWDVFLDAADGWPEPPGDPCLAAGLLVHDGHRVLGVCRDASDVVPADAEPSRPPLRLLGCAPGAELRAALGTGTRRSLALGEAVLEVLGAGGQEVLSRNVTGEVAGWRPSALGSGLVDIDLTEGPREPFPAHARALWDRWLAGPPAESGLWAGYTTRERRLWLDLVRERGCAGGPRTDRPAGLVYEADGRHMTDEPGLYLALGEAMNGPGGYVGCNADALADCLRGGFGVGTPCTVVWRDSSVARRALGATLNASGEPDSRFGVVLEVLAAGGVEVVLR
ncbi:barstar family protein [Streptomyces sp. NPDC026673]|uniref:barstar family protein n=1 Tax=Streptomyces sp. NPDC026673 TaxID=3155724 RepID=UPI0033D2BFF5